MAAPDIAQRPAKKGALRRWLVPGVVFLLLGAVVNVAVAWGCAVFVDVEDQQGPRPSAYWETGNEDLPYWRVSFLSKAGAERVTYKVESSLPRRASKLTYPQRQLPSWLSIDTLPNEFEQPVSSIASSEYCNHEDARGWPALSLKCRYSDLAIYLRRMEFPGPTLDDPNNPYWNSHDIDGDTVIVTQGPEKGAVRFQLVPDDSVVDGILLPVRSSTPRKATGWSHIHVLPLRPIWGGFTLNAVFYAGVLWLVFVGPFVLRRRRRVRKGRCPKCAYPLGESTVCTECGAAVRRFTPPRGV